MRSLASAQSSTSLAYRAIELEEMQKRNTMFALAISIIIHALIVGSYYLFPTPAIDLTGVDWKPGPRIPWTTKEFTIVQGDPSINFRKPSGRIKGVVAGKIIPVPDSKANPLDSFATQIDLRDGVVPNGGGEGEPGSDGPDTGSGPAGDPATLDIPVEPVEYWAVEVKPEIVNQARPVYPEMLRKAELEGTVFVKILVGKDGKPEDFRVEKSANDLFSEAALNAAKQFTFTPGYMTSGPVRVWVSVPFRFKLAR